MSAMETILAGPLVQAIGWALLHLVWQGVLVAAILAATLALLRSQSANARYLASCGALLLLVAMGIATAYRAYDPGLSVATGFSPSDGGLNAAAPLVVASISDLAPDTAWSFTDILVFVNSHLTQIVAVWLAGVVILSTRLIVGLVGARRLTKRRSHAASETWVRSLQRIAVSLRIRRSITLLESAVVEVPTVIGWLRPVVLLPVASLSGLSMEQIEMVLAHELAHIRRHDFIINLLQSIVETLLFYHPAVWWISRRIRVEREHCCDDLAVAVFGNPLQYARALTRFEELRLDAQSVLAANGGSLIARIRRLVVARAESANWSSRWAAGAALITVVAVILAAPTLPLFANHDDQTPKPAPAPAAHAQPCPDKEKGLKCDKAPHATVDVDADEESADDESDNSDNSDEAVRVVAPRVRVAPIAMPRIAIAPMVRSVVMASTEAIEGLVDDEKQQTRRHKIGEGGKLSVDDLIELHTAGVDPKYIEEMRSILGDVTLDDLVALRIQSVTPQYIKDMAAAGYTHLTTRELLSLRIQGVTPKYVQDMASAGYKNLSVNDIIGMRIQGVDANFVKSLADAGYTNLSAKELVRLRVSGVDANFIRELSKYRTK